MLALEGLNGGFGEVFERDLELASSGVGVVQRTVLSGIGTNMKGDVVNARKCRGDVRRAVTTRGYGPQ
jgi:hypothetical protein